MQLGFLAAANRTFAIQWRSEVGSGDWTTIAKVGAEPAERSVHVPDQPPGSLGFYRLVTPAP